MISPLRWSRDRLELLDQRALPFRETWLTCRSWQDVAAAIADMTVRGAPAIGIAAAYGMALAAREADRLPPDEAPDLLQRAARGLVAARPTAVNAAWSVERLLARARERNADPAGQDRRHLFETLADEARRIHEEDLAANRRIGELGAGLLPDGARVYTHCNTGALATGGHGTALGIFRSARDVGRLSHVWVGETRPRLQGARLTMWELLRDGIPATLVVDSAAAPLMARGEVDAVVVGADRIAKNGDVANKVGTYALAIAAKYHGVPVLVAAPWSTVDLATPGGEAIPVEERGADEVTHVAGVPAAAPGARVWNPAFDVTPGALIDAIITERGIARAPLGHALAALAASGGTLSGSGGA